MKLFVLMGLLIVAACGFAPVYQNNSVKENLSIIDVAVIPDYEGQAVRNFLIDRIYENGYPSAPEYQLITNPITEKTIEIGIDRDDNASRAQLRQETSFKLVRLSDNQIVLNRSVRATTGYNILEGSFTTFVTEQDARVQALRTLSDKIIIQLELYFNRADATQT